MGVTQLSLSGIDAAPAPTDGLFFALIPAPEAASKIEQCALDLRKEHGLEGKPLATDHFHITLHYLGAYAGLSQGVVTRAGEAAATVRTAPFDVTLDRAASFSGRPGNRPLVLSSSKDLPALTAFQKTLRAAMILAGLDRWKQPSFSPHVTLLYERRRVPEQAIEPIRWTAREFILVHSLLGRGRHEPVARWPLAG